MFLSPAELRDLINRFEKERTMLQEQIADICYFMKGGVEWDSAWGMSYEDREIVAKTINKRMKEQNPNSKDYM